MEIKHRVDLNKLIPKNPTVAEIGVAEGNLSLTILQEWKPSKLYLVDLWESRAELPGDVSSPQGWHDKNYNTMLAKIEPFKNKVTVLRGFSVEMASRVKDNSLDLIHIDACHSYDCVKADLNAWVSKVKKGGIVSGHDYANNDYGVGQAVNDYCTQNGYTAVLIPELNWVDASFYFIKTH